MKKINLKGASWDSMFLTMAKVLTMAFGIILSKIMSMGLTLEEYGTYSQVNLVTSIGTSAILLGLGDAVNYFFNKKNDEEDEKIRFKIVNTVFFLELIVGIILSVVIIVGRGQIGAYFSNTAIEGILIVASILPVCANIVYFYQVLYVSVGKAKLMSLYNLVLMILKIISAYIAVYVIRDILWIYVVLVVLDLIQIIVYKRTLIKRDVCINVFKISTSHIGKIMSYSLPMGVYALTSTLTRDIDKMIVGRMAGTEKLAIYTNCSKILPFDFLVVSFATVLIPYIVKYVTERNRKQTIQLFSNYMKIGYYSVWILGTMVLIAPENVIAFLYSEEYTVGLPIFILYVFDSMIRFASMHLILTASGKTKQLMIYSVISLGLNVVLNIAFYKLWGLIGPAIATVVVAVIYAYMILRKTISLIECKWKDVFSIKEIAILLGTLVVLCIMGHGLYQCIIAFGGHKYVSMIVSMVVFGCCALLLHLKKIIHVLKEVNSFRM